MTDLSVGLLLFAAIAFGALGTSWLEDASRAWSRADSVICAALGVFCFAAAAACALSVVKALP